jgi:hypothetical protein
MNVNEAVDITIDDALRRPDPVHSMKHESENNSKSTEPEIDPMREPDDEYAPMVEFQIVTLSIRERPFLV